MILASSMHGNSVHTLPVVRRVDTGPNAISGAASSVKGLSAAADGFRTPLAGDERLMSNDLWVDLQQSLWRKNDRLNNRGEQTAFKFIFILDSSWIEENLRKSTYSTPPPHTSMTAISITKFPDVG